MTGDAVGGPAQVVVRRSGGFAGLSVSGRLDLAGDGADARVAEARALVGELDLTGASGEAPAGGATHPDGFVYHFDVDGRQVSLPESALSEGQRRLARLVLEA